MTKRSSIVSYSAEELRAKRARREGRTDWAKVDATSDEALEELIADDPDEPPLPDDWPASVEIGKPRPKRHMNLRVDADVVEWFEEQGKGYQTRMNAVLRSYVEARKKASGR